jgi:hypothetical protein
MGRDGVNLTTRLDAPEQGWGIVGGGSQVIAAGFGRAVVRSGAELGGGGSVGEGQVGGGREIDGDALGIFGRDEFDNAIGFRGVE